ncbi:hypothetical protein YC2023_049265 [Brassica napus]
MDGSGPREGGGGAMKPVILKVGVALVLSATGLILARFVSRKEDNEMVSEEDYRSVLEECGDLKKDVANGVKEVINLRWSNACLRHKRKRLMKKLKRWVEGNEKGRSTKLEERCFGRHSLTVEPEEEQMFHSRRSCSSV